jgi:hypothetical protein
MDRAVFADESCQGTNGSKALVAGGDTAAPGGLEIREKEPYELSGDSAEISTTARRSIGFLDCLATKGISWQSASR